MSPPTVAHHNVISTSRKRRLCHIKSFVSVERHSFHRVVALDKHSVHNLSILKLDITEVYNVPRQDIILVAVVIIKHDLIADREDVRGFPCLHDLVNFSESSHRGSFSLCRNHLCKQKILPCNPLDNHVPSLIKDDRFSDAHTLTSSS